MAMALNVLLQTYEKFEQEISEVDVAFNYDSVIQCWDRMYPKIQIVYEKLPADFPCRAMLISLGNDNTVGRIMRGLGNISKYMMEEDVLSSGPRLLHMMPVLRCLVQDMESRVSQTQTLVSTLDELQKKDDRTSLMSLKFFQSTLEYQGYLDLVKSLHNELSLDLVNGILLNIPLNLPKIRNMRDSLIEKLLVAQKRAAWLESKLDEI